MRILIVTQYYWPENFGINDLAAGLVQRGHQVEVLTGRPNYPGGKLFKEYGFFTPIRETHDGVRIFRVPLIPRGKGRGLELMLNYLSFALAGIFLGPLHCRGTYDCLLVYEPSPITVGLPALVLKTFKKMPLLFWVQDLWPESLSATGAVTSQWILNRVKALVRCIYKYCDRILVQSEAFKTPITELGVASDRLLYFPNSAAALYCPVTVGPDGAERAKMPSGFSVVFAGNIGAAQDFPTILKAAERLKPFADIHFVILGSGRKYAWVKSQITQLGLEKTVHLLGRHPAETMPRFFSMADVLLVTLKKEPIFELTIPSKVQAYMACARPIMAALEGEGARVLNAAGVGITCGAEDPRSLAAGIVKLYQMPKAEREKMGANGRSYFMENFERTFLLKRLESIMQTLQGRNAQ